MLLFVVEELVCMYVSDRRLNDYANVDESIKVYACVFKKKSLTLDRKYQLYEYRGDND